jgi:hypothetical protein
VKTSNVALACSILLQTVSGVMLLPDVPLRSDAKPFNVVVQATVCAKFGLQCIVYMGKKVGHTILARLHAAKTALAPLLACLPGVQDSICAYLPD